MMSTSERLSRREKRPGHSLHLKDTKPPCVRWADDVARARGREAREAHIFAKPELSIVATPAVSPIVWGVSACVRPKAA